MMISLAPRACFRGEGGFCGRRGCVCCCCVYDAVCVFVFALFVCGFVFVLSEGYLILPWYMAHSVLVTDSSMVCSSFRVRLH